MEEQLAKQAVESTKNRPRRQSRRMSIMQRRSSIVSVKSVNSEADQEPDDIDEIEQKPFFRMPFIMKIARLNSPEWFYLLIGGMLHLSLAQ